MWWRLATASRDYDARGGPQTAHTFCLPMARSCLMTPSALMLPLDVAPPPPLMIAPLPHNGSTNSAFAMASRLCGAIHMQEGTSMTSLRPDDRAAVDNGNKHSFWE